MNNFNLMEDEQLVEIFEEVLIKQGTNEKITTIALTNKRLLFLEYITNDGLEALRITKRISFIRYKEVYYTINLDNIELITEEEYYKIILKNNTSFEFNNKELYGLLKGMNV